MAQLVTHNLLRRYIFTQRIERNNLTLRTRIKRLARKTICFSRSVELHEKVIGAFIEKYMFYSLEALPFPETSACKGTDYYYATAGYGSAFYYPGEKTRQYSLMVAYALRAMDGICYNLEGINLLAQLKAFPCRDREVTNAAEKGLS